MTTDDKTTRTGSADVTLALTMMVRDEADIIETMLEFHLAQGVDEILVTDNGSADGTTEILEQYASAGRIRLFHEPVQKKQQGQLVTNMARRAHTEFGADWVINADADEFLRPVDPSKTLRDVFREMPTSLGAFTAPVVNLVGPPAWSGSGVGRLVWRDGRSEEELRLGGVHAQPTPNAIHIGDAGVIVKQGNHHVSIPSTGQPPAGLELEVLHLPWRSWRQFEHKVEIAGRAYRDNPRLKPSPRHHGMRDYARLQQDRLLPIYLLRQPDPADLLPGADHGPFRFDDSLARSLELLPAPRHELATAPESLMEAEFVAEQRELAKTYMLVEADGAAVLELAEEMWAEERRQLVAEIDRRDRELDGFRNRRIVKAAEQLNRLRRR